MKLRAHLAGLGRDEKAVVKRNLNKFRFWLCSEFNSLGIGVSGGLLRTR